MNRDGGSGHKQWSRGSQLQDDAEVMAFDVAKNNTDVGDCGGGGGDEEHVSASIVREKAWGGLGNKE